MNCPKLTGRNGLYSLVLYFNTQESFQIQSFNKLIFSTCQHSFTWTRQHCAFWNALEIKV